MSTFVPCISATVVDSLLAQDPLQPKRTVVLYTMQCASIGANKMLVWWQVARRYVSFAQQNRPALLVRAHT
jgi:hypothetical protein